MSLEEQIRAIVREEMDKRERAEAAPLLMTVPRASAATGIGVDTLREWIAQGRLTRRTKNLQENSKRPIFLVSLDEVKAASEGKRAANSPVDLAAHRLAGKLR